MRSLEDREHLGRRFQLLPVRVRARHVPQQAQPSVRGALRQERDVAHGKPRGTGGNEGAERVRLHESLEGLPVVDLERRGT